MKERPLIVYRPENPNNRGGVKNNQEAQACIYRESRQRAGR